MRKQLSIVQLSVIDQVTLCDAPQGECDRFLQYRRFKTRVLAWFGFAVDGNTLTRPMSFPIERLANPGKDPCNFGSSSWRKVNTLGRRQS